ncbi:nitrophenyl compound nitroreductase subunit ArsF family protein [Lentisphaerota bacterium ZTH]|nr:hypothetical protein JYG24_07360 [Lentisphaerota bacterium]WET06689.1 nitrophenyl compound nitroreductase subunit ArsF family protein [Lentisphaerota bacterium ZTH]
MIKNNFLRNILLCFVVLSLIAVVIKAVNSHNSRTGKSKALSAAVKSIGSRQSNLIIVYYFHGNTRCTACRNIEAYTFGAVQRYFAASLRKKSIILKSVNVELSENEHFVYDYELSSRAVVLSKLKDGSQTDWKKLQQVWKLNGDKQAFFEYIKKEITGFSK